jgi:hypothetical protein
MFLLVAAWLSAAAGCATVEYGGFVLDKSHTDWAFDQVRNRASFELHCPREQIELVILNTSTGTRGAKWNPTTAQQIGASGCQQRAVYVSSSSGWVLDSTSTKDQGHQGDSWTRLR